ncbi:ferredoxin reductase family protein [Aestuariimicrobium kwangyangense]|uniref:ferredoxin reductase family protein n=1 Tax=Aestuariimicrobium kwangyangense TaxID=396389 RepID=UPI00047B1397|nr:ferredoxin reductase family protein [Aestuariimicrobium kwangyangense]
MSVTVRPSSQQAPPRQGRVPAAPRPSWGRSDGASLPGARRRSWLRRARADLVTVTGWVLIAASVAVFLAGRSDYGFGSIAKALTSLGAIAGLVAMTLMVLMLLLAARIPFVDRAIGHDGALELHRRLGPSTFITLGLHIFFLTAAWSVTAGSWSGGISDLWSTPDVVLAIVGTGVAALVGLTSVPAARRLIPREVWHVVHVTSYAAIGLAIPHQFTTGGLLAGGVVRDYWVLLLSATAAALVAFRVVRPLVGSLEHGLRVASVRPVSRDSVCITMTGRNLDHLGARPGQFLSWRFWAPGLWWHAHPFSLSAAPDGRSLSITVRGLGTGTRSLAAVRLGTRVSVEGPFGLLTPDVRTRVPVVLAGAGVGLAPLKSLLEGMEVEPGRAVVIARGSRQDDLVHLAEFDRLCRAKGAQLVVLTGSRGGSWAPASAGPLHLAHVVGWIAQADLYICGPQAWADALTEEAMQAGLDADHIHHERFSW